MGGARRVGGAVEQAAQQVAALVAGQLLRGAGPQQEQRRRGRALDEGLLGVRREAAVVDDPERAEGLAAGPDGDGEPRQVVAALQRGQPDHALGREQHPVLLRVGGAPGYLEAEDARAAVLVDRLPGNRRVGEDPLPRVLDHGGAADGRGHRVGQSEQVPQTAPGGRRSRPDRGGEQQMHVVPGGVLVHGQQGHTRRLRLRERAVRAAYDQSAHPRLRRRPRQRPRRGRPHPDREQQRPGRTGQRRVGVVQQRLGDGHVEPGGRGVQPYGGAADDVQQVTEGAGVHEAPSGEWEWGGGGGWGWG
ncbi:hypothetical protein HEP87_60290 [Streptomyces sp. S1D4-11]